MTRDFYIACAYHGFRASILGLSVALAAYRVTPDSWTWVILGVGALAQFVNGVDSYLQESKGAKQ